MSTQTVFTQVRLGKIDGQIIYSSDDVFVILTIAPHNPGHCLVIPVEEYEEFTKLPDQLSARMITVARQVMMATYAIYGPPRVALIIAGLEVPHVHIHVFSLFNTNDIDPHRAQIVGTDKLAIEAMKLSTYFKENPIK